LLFRRSPLVQGRGLKRSVDLDQDQPLAVAPRAGAWIETGKGNAV